MATQDLAQGQLQDFLAILKRRAWQIVIPGALGLAVGVFMATLLPRRYDVKAALEVHRIDPPIGGKGFDSGDMIGELTNASLILTAAERMRRLVEKQEWEDYASLSREEQFEYLTDVAKRIKVKPVGVGKNATLTSSAFVSLEYWDTDPLRAARFCNELRDGLVEEFVQRGREKALEDRDKLQKIRGEKQLVYEESQRKLSELRKNNTLSLTQPAPGTGVRDEDPVFRLLSDTQANLMKVRQDIETEEKQNELFQQQYDEEPPEVPATSQTLGLDVTAKVAALEEQIDALRLDQEDVKPAHSKWKIIQEEINQKDEQRRLILGRATPDAVDLSYVPNPKRAQYQLRLQDSDAQLETLGAREKKLAEDVNELGLKHAGLAQVYQQVDILSATVEMSRQAFIDADNRFQTQKDFYEYISGPAGNPFEVTERAEPPRTPSSPIVPMVIGMYGLIGAGLGLVAGLVAEFGRNAYRSVGDVTRSMAVPVLGSIDSIITREESRVRTIRRAAIGAASLVLIGTILWVTWAWTSRPSLLGSDVQDLIQRLRDQLR